MSIQVLEQQGNVFGRIGKGLGKGLSEQLPKEVERSRLSKGLRELGQQKDLTPFEQVSRLYSLPGMTPEIASNVVPLLQQQLQKQEFQKRDIRKPLDQVSIQKSESDMTPIPRRLQEDYLRPSTQEQINQRAEELFISQPNLYRTVEAAREQAQKEESRRLAQDQSIENLQTKLKDRFDKSLSDLLQKNKLGSLDQVPGEIQRKYLEQMEERVLDKGESFQKVADEFSRKGLEYAKANQKLKTIGRGLGDSTADLKRSINDVRKVYEDSDALNLMRNDLIAYNGLSPEAASTLTYPISKNKQLEQKLDGISKNARYRAENPKSYAKIVEEVGKNIKPGDSINSIAMFMRKKGYDPQQVKNRIYQEYEQGNISLTNEQREEAKETTSFFPYLSDILLFERLNMGALVQP